MPSKKNKHVKYRQPQDAQPDPDPDARPPTAEERAVICAQAIVDAQIKTGAVTQDGMVKMFLRQLLEHEDAAYDRVIRLCQHMGEDENVDTMKASEVLLALANELKGIQQPPPPAQPGVHLP